MKFLSFTENARQLQPLVPLLEDLTYQERCEGMSIIATPEEFALARNPWIIRYYQEFHADARRALLEERPDCVLIGPGCSLEASLRQWCSELGIPVWPDRRRGAIAVAEPPPLDFSASPLRVPIGPYRYGDYQHELQPGGRDLKPLLAERFERWRIRAEDGHFIVSPGESQGHWLDRFRLSKSGLNIVFLDSQNIAGSVMNHTLAVNRYSPHRAVGVSTMRHPFIDYPDAPMMYTDDPNLKRELEKADAFVFFEDDDEESSAWPIDLKPLLAGKPILHLYIGYRVHRDVPRFQRPGRRILTPLPHLMRMFPTAHFYAGFPPCSLDDVELRPPLSSEDGILRVLHTPSLPNPTTHRYYYHKDTDRFLEAAQKLCGKAEFWQLAGLPHQEILKARQDTDITFNQLRGYMGLSGDEAMYLERPTVQAFDQWNINRHREYWGLDTEFPWVNSTPESLVADLEILLESDSTRRELGHKGRQFMLEYFSPRAGIQPLLWHVESVL